MCPQDTALSRGEQGINRSGVEKQPIRRVNHECLRENMPQGYAPRNGLVAQLEERRLCKAEALGSNPSKSTTAHA